jgi:hypothetical protein
MGFNSIKQSKPKEETTKPRRPPGRTIKSREDQLIEMANSLAERQIRNGTASSQVVTHFLRLGSSRAQLENTKIEHETILLQAKTEALASAKRMEALYAEALLAMRRYSGAISVVPEDLPELEDGDDDL